MKTLGANYGVGDLTRMCGRCISRSVDLTQSENATNAEDSLVQKDNNNDDSIIEDTTLGNDPFDPLLDDTCAPQLKNNHEDEIEKKIFTNN